MMLGTAFFYKEIKRNETNDRPIVPTGGHPVTIVASVEDGAVVQ